MNWILNQLRENALKNLSQKKNNLENTLLLHDIPMWLSGLSDADIGKIKTATPSKITVDHFSLPITCYYHLKPGSQPIIQNYLKRDL